MLGNDEHVRRTFVFLEATIRRRDWLYGHAGEVGFEIAIEAAIADQDLQFAIPARWKNRCDRKMGRVMGISIPLLENGARCLRSKVITRLVVSTVPSRFACEPASDATADFPNRWASSAWNVANTLMMCRRRARFA
jgi:hypothetical protein